MALTPGLAWNRLTKNGMAQWRSLPKVVLVARNARPFMTQQIRLGGHGPPKMNIIPSSWNFKVTQDWLHFYAMIFGIPLAIISAYMNLKVGPAKLAPIPEGYVPREEEYYRHPITRLIQKYILCTEQEIYERKLHDLWEARKKQQQKMLIEEVRRLQKFDGDYKGYYYLPYSARTSRVIKQEMEKNKEQIGRHID